MHELSITQEIIDIVTDKAKMYNARRVSFIKLKFGLLTTVDADCFRFYFDELTKGTILEGSTVDIERNGIKVECKKCGIKSDMDDIIMICPQCSSMDLNIISGREMLVENIEVEL